MRNSSETSRFHETLRLYTDIFCVNIFYGINALFDLRNSVKIKYTIETVCQSNSSETARQNFMKFCSYTEHTV